MKISVVIAVFNAEQYIDDAIKSVISQTMPAHEIIVVDDGSTDRTPDILEFPRNQIRAVRQENTGASKAFNVGVSLVTGDYLAFLDADDLWYKSKLDLQRAAFENCSDLDAVFGYVQQFISPDISEADAATYVAPDHPQPGISKNTMLIRTNSFLRIGSFDPSNRIADFTEWYPRAIALGLKFTLLPQTLAYRRLHKLNSGRVHREKEQQETLRGLKKALDLRRNSNKKLSNSE